jgi:LuxR family maltose regulon positive regulatory protein
VLFRSQPCALVLDDYHLLTEPRIHESMEFLLAYLPPTLHLILAARADPPLPLARMRTRRELSEVRVADLACTEDEASALLSGTSEQEPRAVAELVARTEGWPAGLHLSRLALREHGDPAAVLSGEQRPIGDYFLQEVLPSLDARARDLLIRCSVLDQLSGPLCDAVLGTTGSATVLDRVEHADVFLTAVDPRRHWYRCHQLFREVLRRELDSTSREEAAALLDRAADWYLQEGRVEEAIRLRITAGDETGAFAVLRGRTRWFLDHGASASMLHLGEQLAGRCAADPLLSAWLARSAGLSGQPRETVRRWLEAAEPYITNHVPPPSGWRTLRAFTDATWCGYGVPDDSAACLRLARRAVRLEDDPAQWGWVDARLMLAVAQRGVGQLNEAASLLQQAWQVPGRRALPALLALQTAGELMLDLLALGEHDQARRIGAEVAVAATTIEEQWGPGAAAAVGRLRLSEARLTLAQHGARAALPGLARAVRLAEDWHARNLTVLALTSQAAALWATGDRSAARTALARARDSAEADPPRPYVTSELEALETRLGRRSMHEARAHGEMIEELTDRELSVLRALAGPLTAREIGAELYLSINTVKGYTKSLYRKLGVATRADAISRGRELGLI